MNGFQLDCYINCLSKSGLFNIIVILIVFTIFFIILYGITRKAKLILTAQMVTTAVITLNFISMNCDTFQLVWLYIGIVFGGGFLIWTTKYYIFQQCQDTINSPRFISKFENNFNVKIHILSSQKIKAFVFQNKIYVTMGLLERLNQDELRAVLAHEIYHIKYSPNKLLSSLLALTSLTFKRHNDDPMADKYAARIAGADNLISAFRKLEIIDGEERIRKLAG